MGKLSAAQVRHFAVTKRHTASAFSTLVFGLCTLLPGSVIAAETNTTETTQPAAQTPDSKKKEQQDQTLIVTGEKSDRTIFDTGSSVEVFDQKRIESMANATKVSDLLRMTANVVDTGTGNDLPTVRGIDGSGPSTGAGAFLSGTRPRLGLSVDGRSLTYNEQAYSSPSLWDMDRVEVFLGPQSYIQGRNAIAGAIVMTSKNPTFDTESAFKGGFGNYNSSQLAAMFNVPIVDEQLALRVSAERQKRRSDVDMPSYQPVGDPREVQTTTARAKLLYNPENWRDFTSLFTFNHADNGSPQNESNDPLVDPSSARYDYRRPVFKSNTNSGIWNVAWEPTQTLKVENNIGYTGFNVNRYTGYNLPYAHIKGHELQVEPSVHFGDRDTVVRGLAGLRYFDASQDEYVYLFGGSTFEDKTKTASAYGELTYSLTPTIDLTGSSRLEREHRTRNGGSGSVRLDFDDTYNVFLPKVDLAWKPTDVQTYGARIARGYNAGGAGITLAAPYTNYSYGAEYVWNYELYSRHQIGDVLLTSNLFYNDYKDMQLPYYLSSSSSVIRNADKVVTYGAEFGANWTPSLDWNLFGKIGLLDTKIKEFGGSGVEGHQLARAPHFTANGGAKYQFLQSWEVSADVSFSDGYFSAYDNDARGKVGSYWTANAQLAYTFTRGRATLFAKNLFDSDRYVMISSNNINTAIQQRAALYGVALELDF